MLLTQVAALRSSGCAPSATAVRAADPSRLRVDCDLSEEENAKRRPLIGGTQVEKVLAAVRTGPSRTEIREFPMPEIPEDSALMKMEVAGICGTDVKLYKTPPSSAPVIMGHENIGTIAKAGREFIRRKGDPLAPFRASRKALGRRCEAADALQLGSLLQSGGAREATDGAARFPARPGDEACGAGRGAEGIQRRLSA